MYSHCKSAGETKALLLLFPPYSMSEEQAANWNCSFASSRLSCAAIQGQWAACW